MNGDEFARFRKRLNKTQKQMSTLLGSSIKAIHSYEQGWRSIPAHAERQILFLVSRHNDQYQKRHPCWEVKKCPDRLKLQCPAWEFQSGDLCWFINGTRCDGQVHKKWQDKMTVCRSCEVFETSIPPSENE